MGAAPCIKHAFQSAKADSADTTIVRPSDWNACHVIEDGAISEDKLDFDPATQAELDAHAAETTNVHGIADTSVLETTSGAQSKVDAHVNDSSAAHAASAIANTPAGNISATDVQAALNELDSEKQPAGSYLTGVTADSPLSGSGTSGSHLTVGNAAADGSTKGAASFNANDFDASSGNISIDYTNGQKASSSQPGFLSSTDWSTFNGKESALTFSAPLSRSTNTVSIPDAAADGSTKGAASFNASDFNSSSGNISIDYTNGQAASGSAKGFLNSSDWSAFNGKAPGDAHYLTTQSEIGLSAEANLGALTTGILKHTVSGGVSTPATAVSGTDYAPATSGSALLKGNGSGGFSNAISGTDYVGATSGSAIQKASSGNLTAAASSDVVSLFGSGSCSGYLKSDGTCSTPSASVGDLLGWRFVRKSADQTTTSGTLANDNHLVLPIGANETQVCRATFFVDGPTGGDFMWGYNVPSGAAGRSWQEVGFDDGIGSGLNEAALRNNQNVLAANANTIAGASGTANTGSGNGVAVVAGLIVRNGANAGNIQMMIAQLAASGTTTVYTDSFMICQRVN